MSNTASNYDTTKLYAGIALALISSFLAIVVTRLTQPGQASGMVWLSVLCLGHGTVMFASSFVEEEHHFWYWMVGGWIARLQFSRSKVTHIEAPHTQRSRSYNVGRLWLTRDFAAVITLIITRFSHRWNQTGQKHAGSSDIGRTFLQSHNIILWVLVAGTYASISYRIGSHGLPLLPKILSLAIACGTSCAAFWFKITFTNADAPELLNGLEGFPISTLPNVPLITQARIVFMAIALILLLMMVSRYKVIKTSSKIVLRLQFLDTNHYMRPIHDLLTLFLMTQSRVNNIPLLALFVLQLETIDALVLTPDEMTLTQLIFQHSSFFVFGGSNAISSVDLSSAYNGVGDYNAVAVGVLTFFCNWTGPIWWAIGLSTIMAERHGRKGKVVLRHCSLLTLFTASSLAFVMLACTVLRTHLFIWTVFSPKYLYSMAWSLGQHICINLILGGLIVSTGPLE